MRFKTEEGAFEKVRQRLKPENKLNKIPANVPVEILDTQTGKDQTAHVRPKEYFIFALNGKQFLTIRAVHSLIYQPFVYGKNNACRPATEDRFAHRNYIFVQPSATLYYIKDKSNILKKISFKSPSNEKVAVPDGKPDIGAREYLEEKSAEKK